MAVLTTADRKTLLILARSAIASELIDGVRIERPAEIPAAMQELRGCFVTLHKKGRLRGCIGTIEPTRSLISNVEDNALNAAFRDPRFPALQADELPLVDMEISVLSKPEVLPFKNAEDLKSMLKPKIHGVILSKGWKSATFLPQVWEQLPEKEMFLSHLCRKAGMKENDWQCEGITVKVYEAEYFSE